MKGHRTALGVAILTMAFALYGCGGDPASPGPTDAGSPDPTDAELVQVRVAVTADAGIDVTPVLLAFEAMADRGYEVVPQLYPNPITAMQAVIAGEADIGSADAVVVINANNAGQDFRIFAVEQGVAFALVAPTSITSPEGLDGLRVGHHSMGSFTRGLALFAAEQYDIEPEFLVLEGSEVRAEALANGQLDGSILDLEQTVILQGLRPGEFHALIAFPREFPGLMGGSLYGSAEWLADNEEFAQAMTEEIINTNRRVASDPDYLAEEVLARGGFTGDREQLDEIIALYIESNVWDVNGGFTEEAALETVGIFVEIGDLEEAPPFSEWATLQYVDRALDTLGRE